MHSGVISRNDGINLSPALVEIVYVRIAQIQKGAKITILSDCVFE